MPAAYAAGSGAVAGTADRFGYESNINVKRAIKTADKVLQDGWALRGYPVIHLTGDIPWVTATPELRSWTFHVHSLDMLEEVLTAHDATRDPAYLRAALHVALHWIARHPRDAADPPVMAWYDMAVGQRAYRMAYIFQAACDADLMSATERALFWQALEDHRAELADDAKIAFHNNHGYYQIVGQLALGRRFAAVSPAMQQLYDQGVVRFGRILDQQFSVEDIHREHSPDYHRMVLDSLKKTLQSGLIVDPDLQARVRHIEDELAWFVDPQGDIVNFGDTDSRSMLRSQDSPQSRWETPLMQAVGSSPADTGLPRPSGLHLLPQSGYAIVRQPGPDAPADRARDSYLAQTAAFHSRTHKHADDLSFVWHDRGEALLVDAGRYGYVGKAVQGTALWQDGHWYDHPMRVHVESTRAHNTLEFDGRNNPRMGVTPYGSGIVAGVAEAGTFAIETQCRLFTTIRRDRVLVFRPGAWLLVFDVFTDNLDAPHDVRQWFHTAPGSQVEQVAEGYRITTAGGQVLRAAALLPGTAPLPVEVGVEEPRLQGWWAGKQGKAVPSPAFGFMASGCRTGIFATIFTFGDTLVPRTERAISNVTGRRFRVLWSDAEGDHTIVLHRDEGLRLVEVS